MSVCKVCGEILDFVTCPDCYKRYEDDVRTGHIPPQFIAAGEQFDYIDWYDIKACERRCAERRMKPEDVAIEVNTVILFCLERHGHLRTQANQTPAQRKKAADDRIKKFSTY